MGPTQENGGDVVTTDLSYVSINPYSQSGGQPQLIQNAQCQSFHFWLRKETLPTNLGNLWSCVTPSPPLTASPPSPQHDPHPSF